MKKVGIYVVGLLLGLMSLVAVSSAKDEPFAESVIIPIEESLSCGLGEVVTSPFLEVDTQAMINQLSGADFDKAQRLFSDVERHYQTLESDLSIEGEAKLFVLEGRLADLLEEKLEDGKITCVTRDLLSNMSEEDKFRALSLWHDIQKTMLSGSSELSEDVDAKFEEIDQLIFSAES